MRRTLYWKFIFAYMILAILSLLVVTTLGRQLVLNNRVKAEADTLYAEASRIADGHGVRYFVESANLRDSYENLRVIADADESVQSYSVVPSKLVIDASAFDSERIGRKQTLLACATDSTASLESLVANVEFVNTPRRSQGTVTIEDNGTKLVYKSIGGGTVIVIR